LIEGESEPAPGDPDVAVTAEPDRPISPSGGPDSPRSPGSEGSTGESPAGHRKRRGRGPWIASIVAVIAVAGVFGSVFLAPDLASLAANGLGGAPQGSGGIGGDNDSQSQVLIGSGTVWAVGTEGFLARELVIATETELEGSFSASGSVRVFLINESSLAPWVGSSASSGPLPSNSSPPVADIAWSSGTTDSGYLDTFVPPGTYALVVTTVSAGVEFHFTSDFVANTGDLT
jgi:hypothetical protein